MPSGRLWTPEEDRLVREAASANQAHGLRTPEGRTHGQGTCTKTSFEGRLEAVAKRIGRTTNAVRLRACRIRARSRLDGTADA